jgi:hypothetical protein
MVTNSLISLFRRGRGDPAFYLNASLIAATALAVILDVFVSPCFEVRDRGLICRGRLISWLNIEGYDWESSDDPGGLTVLSLRPVKAVLRLHISRLFSILPPPRIHIPSERQEQLEAILKRHLSEWPQ